MGFAADLAKLCERAGDKAELVVRKVALDLQGQMIDRSPVDTGRFKGNWVVGVGAINTKTDHHSAKVGSAPLERTRKALIEWVPGQTIWLTNSMPYATKLENGHSKQAPVGMVRLTIQNYAQAIAKAAREVK